MHRINAVTARNQGRDIRRNESFLDCAARFRHLAHYDQVDITRHRVRCEYGFSADGCRTIARKNLDAIDSRAGSLRDSGDECRLRDIAVGLGDIHQPVGEHAAALPADGENCD
jgi:hypothetical protein